MKQFTNFFKNNSTIVLFIIFIVVINLFVFSSIKELVFINFFFEIYERASHLIQKNVLLFSIVAILFFCSWIFFLLPFVSLLQILFGLIFDLYLGFIINYVSIILGSYLIFSFLNLKVINKIKYLNELETKYLQYERFSKNKFLFVFVMKLFPGVPFMLQNIFAAIIKINHKTFLLASSLGIWPLVLMNTYFGSKINISFKESIEINLLNNNNIILFIAIYFLFINFFFRFFKK